jgi:hypothetical protein
MVILERIERLALVGLYGMFAVERIPGTTAAEASMDVKRDREEEVEERERGHVDEMLAVSCDCCVRTMTPESAPLVRFRQ